MDREPGIPHIVGVGGTLRDNSTSLFALKRALHYAELAGATTDLVDLASFRLPLYEPHKQIEDYPSVVEDFIKMLRGADGMLWSTGAYHGTLAGVTKNALDYFEFLSEEDPPYLKDKVVGVIATAGGNIAAVNAANAMVHIVHALRGTAVPLMVPIPQAWRVVSPQKGVIDKKWDTRLEKLGRLVYEMATKFQIPEKEADVIPSGLLSNNNKVGIMAASN